MSLMLSLLCASVYIVSPLAPVSPIPQKSLWKRFELKPLYMSVLSPAKPKPFKINLVQPDHQVEKSAWYAHTDTSFNLIYCYTVYKPGVKANLLNAIRGTIEGIKQSHSNSVVTHNSRKITHSGMPGYKLQVKYSEKGANIVFQSILVGKSNRMWQIITTAEPDPTYAAMASKALAGVVIKP